MASVSVSALVKKSLTPLIALNGVGMAVGGIWLLFYNALGSMWPAVIALMVSPFVFPLLMFPAAFGAGIARVMEPVKPRLAKAMLVAGIGWLVLLFTSYVMLSFDLVSQLMMYQESLLPALIWAISVGVLPWAIIAAKDRDNIFMTGLVLMTEAVSIFVAWAAVFWSLRFWHAYWLFLALLATCVALQAAYEALFLDKKQ